MEEDGQMTIEQLKEIKDFHAFTEQTLCDLKYAFSMDYTVEQACHHANISKNSYYRWIKASNEFAEAMEKAKTDPIRAAKNTLITAAKNGDIKSARFLLERREKQNYAARQEVTDGEGKPLDTGKEQLTQIATTLTQLVNGQTTNSEGNS